MSSMKQHLEERDLNHSHACIASLDNFIHLASQAGTALEEVGSLVIVLPNQTRWPSPT